MVDLMRSLGVEAVPTVGSPFDPNVHDAIMREPSNAHPDGTVLGEFRKGFSLGGKLLRPAMVKVGGCTTQGEGCTARDEVECAGNGPRSRLLLRATTIGTGWLRGWGLTGERLDRAHGLQLQGLASCTKPWQAGRCMAQGPGGRVGQQGRSS